MNEELEEERPKTNPGMYVLLAGLILIFIGVAINFYNEMFAKKDVAKEPEETIVRDTVVVPTDMNEVTEQLSKDLGTYIDLYYDPAKDSGKDLLNDAFKRIALINVLLEESGNVEHATNNPDNPFPYVKEEVFKEKYVEVYGSDEKYDSDMSVAYSATEYVKNVLGEDGYIGWLSELKPVSIERILTANDVTYDEDTKLFTITGTYSDTQLGATSGEGTFTVVYADNYIVSMTFTEGSTTQAE